MELNAVVDEHPYADTRAARVLSEALKDYTARHAGGLRTLAARLDMKQATNLSHMANGRMPIPLDRAAELATVLEIDVVDFCLAVLEQRAPAAYDALENQLPVRALAARPPQVRSACSIVADASEISDEHVDVISEVVGDRHPAERWLQPSEVPVIVMIRERYPNGLGASELGVLGAAMDALQELDL